MTNLHPVSKSWFHLNAEMTVWNKVTPEIDKIPVIKRLKS